MKILYTEAVIYPRSQNPLNRNITRIYKSLILVLRKAGYNSLGHLKRTGISRNQIIADKLKYIPNDDTQYYPFYRIQLVVESFGQST